MARPQIRHTQILCVNPSNNKGTIELYTLVFFFFDFKLNKDFKLPAMVVSTVADMGVEVDDMFCN